MVISDVIERLIQIKKRHGDMECYITCEGIISLQEENIICVAKGNSLNKKDGVYFWKAYE